MNDLLAGHRMDILPFLSILWTGFWRIRRFCGHKMEKHREIFILCPGELLFFNGLFHFTEIIAVSEIEPVAGMDLKDCYDILGVVIHMASYLILFYFV